MANAEIKAVITAEDRASSVLSNFSKHVDHASNVALLGFAAATTAVVAFGVASVKAFTESENVMAQTNAVLKSTGGVAGVTADEVTKLASALQKTTTFSDESVQSAENLLLTFTSIGKDIFPQATKTVLDMSIALGQDTKRSAIQLGKALQDPILGITALRRVGANFSDDQKEVVKQLVETGRSAEAQQLILKELNTEFGGSATAAAKTFGGQLKIIWNQLDDVMEAIGKVIASAIQPFIDKLKNWFENAGGVEGIMDKLKDTLKKVEENIGVLAGAITAMLLPSLAKLALSLLAVAWPLALLATAGAAIGLLINEWVKNNGGWKKSWDDIRDSVQGLWDKISPVLIPVLKELWSIIETQVIPVFKKFWAENSSWLIPVLEKVAIASLILAGVFIGSVVVAILAVGAVITGLVGAYNEMKAAGERAWQGIKDKWNEAVGFFNGVKDGITLAFNSVWAAIVAPFRGAFNEVIDLYNKTIGRIAGRIQINATPTAGGGASINIGGMTQVGKLAEGTDNWRGGPTWVGERGPELLNLPKGSQVTPNNKLGGDTINISINAGAFMGSDVEARKFAQVIANHLKDVAGSKNMSTSSFLDSRTFSVGT